MQRTIHFTVSANGDIAPCVPQYAGIQGEHNAATVMFDVTAWKAEEFVYRAEFVDGFGSGDTTVTLKPENGVVAVALPRQWTNAGGQAVLRLVASILTDGEETQTVYAVDAPLYFGDKQNAGQDMEEELTSGLTELITGALRATEGAEEATEDADAAAVAAIGAAKKAEAAAGSADGAAENANTAVAELRAAAASGAFDGERGEKGERGPQGVGSVTKEVLFESSSGYGVIGETFMNADPSLYDYFEVEVHGCVFTARDANIAAGTTLISGGANMRVGYGDLIIYGSSFEVNANNDWRCNACSSVRYNSNGEQVDGYTSDRIYKITGVRLVNDGTIEKLIDEAEAAAKTATDAAAELRSMAESGAFDGKNGLNGEQGPTGPQGPQGPQGEKGEKGDPGNTNLWYGECNTGSIATEKVVATDEKFALREGVRIMVHFGQGGSSPNATLKVNNTQAIEIRTTYDGYPDAGTWGSDQCVEFVYCRGIWQIVGTPKPSNYATNYGRVKLSDSVSEGSNDDIYNGIAATPFAVKMAYDKAVEAYNAAQKEWTLIEDLTLAENVTIVSWNLSEQDYKEVWIEGNLSVLNVSDSAASLRFRLGRTSSQTVVSQDISNVASGTTTLYVRAHGYIAPSKKQIYEMCISRYKYTNGTVYRNAGDPTTTNRESMDQVAVSCTVPSGTNYFVFGAGTSLKIWGR